MATKRKAAEQANKEESRAQYQRRQVDRVLSRPLLGPLSRFIRQDGQWQRVSAAIITPSLACRLHFLWTSFRANVLMKLPPPIKSLGPCSICSFHLFIVLIAFRSLFIGLDSIVFGYLDLIALIFVWFDQVPYCWYCCVFIKWMVDDFSWYW